MKMCINIEWKGEAIKTQQQTVYEEKKTKEYFSNIYQSTKREGHPVLDDIIHTGKRREL